MAALLKERAAAVDPMKLPYRTVGSGGSFGASPLRQHLGLGDARRVLSLEVVWPATGKTQILTGVEPRHRYHVREGDGRARRVDRPAFTLAGI